MIGADYTCSHGETHPCPHGCAEVEAARAQRLIRAVRDGAWLDAQTFPPLRWAVPGILPEGFTLLVGAPKTGKSWLALSILLAIACGGRALGTIDVPKGRVLYLALEDGHRRMQDRCRSLMEGEPLSALYTYATRVTPLDVLPTIEAYIEAHPETVLVVIDTLGKVMPPALPNETTYQRDYRVGGRLKAITDASPGLALVVVHHDRKAESADFVDRVSGTHGLAGSADTIVVLSRERLAAEGTLHVTGRDVDEGEYALTVAAGAWTLEGATLTESAALARKRAATEGVGDRMADVIRYVAEHPEGVGPSDIAAALKIEPKTVSTYLSRALASGRVGRAKRGLYTPVGSVGSVGFDSWSSIQSNIPTDPTDPLDPGDES